MADEKTIAALWCFDKAERYPPQFVGAVSEGLRDAWYEESERIRELAEQWFSEFDDDPEMPDRWRFEVVYQRVPVPADTASLALPREQR